MTLEARGKKPKSRFSGRLLKWAVAGLSLLALGAVLWFRFSYPGFAEMVWADWSYASWHENRAQYRFLNYYARYLSRLRPDGPIVGIPPPHAAQQPFEQGMTHFHRGDFAAAVEQIREHIRRHGESQESLFWLVAALMRRAESESCLPLAAGQGDSSPLGRKASPTVCTLPIHTPCHHPESIQSAAALLEKLLDEYAPQDPLYLWLLNFAYMAQGRYPDGVPARHLLRSEFTDLFYGEGRQRARNRFGWLKFRDRAGELGVDLLDAGKGLAVEDFDGDGDLDMVTGSTHGRLYYYRNQDGRRFVEASREAGLSDVLQPFIITAADYDNDGAMDLFVSRPFHHFQLLRNNGQGTFEDVTFSSGLLEPEDLRDQGIYSFVSAWADVDNDGDLDLMLAQFGERMPMTSGLFERPLMPSRLYINERGRFSNRTAQFGLTDLFRDRIFFGAAFGDYDRDGWIDLFLSSYTRGLGLLLRNRAGQRFEDSGLIRPREAGFMAAFVDVDHDGRLDVFQGGQSPARIATEDSVFRRRPQRNASRIFLQTQGGFQDRRDLFSFPISAGTMGANFGDINNDGCYDFYLGTGNPESWYVLPNLMYVGEVEGTRCSGRMSNATMLEGLGTIQKGHGIVFFDFDGDGDQDIYSSLGGMWQGDAWPNQMLVNESTLDNAWVKIRLRGRRSNRWGLGSLISVQAENGAGQPIKRTYLMDNGTGFGSSPYLAHIGLLDAVRVLKTTVIWPASGCIGEYQVEIRRLNWLDEGDCLQLD